MAGQANASGNDFLKTLQEAIGDAEQLQDRVSQLLRVMKYRGLLFSDAPAQLVRSLLQKLLLAKYKAQSVDRKLQQFQKLVDTSALLTSSLELDRVLEEVVDTIIGLTGCERAYLVLQDRDSSELTIRAARNWDKDNLSKDEIGFSRGVVSTVLEQRQPILTSNAVNDSRFEHRESILSQTVRSIVCIPLLLREQTIGVLYADSRVKEGTFGPEILPVLTAFANQAAIAIDNARLFEQVKRELDSAQQEVQTLRIQIDRQQTDSQIDEIVNSDLFKRLIPRDPPSTEP